MGQPVHSLPLSMRLKRYRALAEDALNRARLASDERIKAGFLGMASDWQVLADDVEKVTARFDPSGEPESSETDSKRTGHRRRAH